MDVTCYDADGLACNNVTPTKKGAAEQANVSGGNEATVKSDICESVDRGEGSGRSLFLLP